MIDIKKQANAEIKMLDFDLPNLVAKYQKPLADYLATGNLTKVDISEWYPQTLVTDASATDAPFTDRMSLSADGYELMLNNVGLINKERSFDFCFARKASHLWRNDNESYFDWAKRILINYRNWIRKEWSKEKKMTTEELVNYADRLYTQKSFIDHFVSELPLNNLDFIINDHNNFTNQILIPNFDYFAAKIITAPNKKAICRDYAFQDCITHLLNQYGTQIKLTINVKVMLQLVLDELKPESFCNIMRGFVK